MSSERDEDFANIDPHLESSDSLQVHPPTSDHSSVDHTASSVYDSSSLSSLSAGFSSTSSHPTVDDFLVPDRNLLIQFRVQQLEEGHAALKNTVEAQGRLLQEISKRLHELDDGEDEESLKKRQKVEEKLTVRPLTGVTTRVRSLSEEKAKTRKEIMVSFPLLYDRILTEKRKKGTSRSRDDDPCRSEQGCSFPARWHDTR